MSNKIGNKISVSIFGQSHSQAIGCVIEGLPAGFAPDLEKIQLDLNRRRGGQNRYSTKRTEADTPDIISGLYNGKCCAAPLCVLFYNNDTKSSDYNELSDKPRPGHADYTAYIRSGGNNDIRGGGEFSGRLTLPLCFAGSLAKQLLAAKGITVGAHIARIGDVTDELYNPISLSESDLAVRDFPCLCEQSGEKMKALMTEVANSGDSIGGIIECAAIGVPPGLGSPMFEGIENEIAKIVFGIPAVKGIEFGRGFEVSTLRGSENNDPFEINGSQIKTKTNNAGGILGGITNGMPIIFRCAIKPTPSIAIAQQTVSLSNRTNESLSIRGRHDPCIVPRAVPVVEAACALALVNTIY